MNKGIKKLIFNRKKIAALVSMGIILTTPSSTAIFAQKADAIDIKKAIKSEDFITDNIGSINNGEINPTIKNATKASNNFTYLKMKNNKINEEKLKKAIDDKKSVGLIVTPVELNHSSIYKTVDTVKDYISKYNLNCSILYDISDNMNESNIADNCLMAEEFCNKLSDNGCYVGLYGTNNDMLKFSKEFKKNVRTHSIDDYDKMIAVDKVEDIKNIDPTISNNMVSVDDNTVLWKYKLDDVIEKNDLNNPDNFVDDFVYKVEEGDSLYKIATEYNISLEDLRSYNDLPSNTIYAEQEIKIPNKYSKEEEKKLSNNLMRGMDISQFQGKIDWDKVEKQTDFVILRVCDTSVGALDPTFFENAKECEKRNIPYGAYYYSNATNNEEAIKEAEDVCKIIEGMSLDCPLYIDAETDLLNNLMFYHAEDFKEMVNGAFDVIKNYGFYPGLYGNRNNADYIMSLDCTFWFTSGPTYNNETNLVDLCDDDLAFFPDEEKNIDMYQYCQKGKVDGIENEVDIDYANRSLLEKVKNNTLESPSNMI